MGCGFYIQKIEYLEFIENVINIWKLWQCFSETKTDDINIMEKLQKFKTIGFQMFISNTHKSKNCLSGGVITAVSNKIAGKCVEKLD